VPLVFSPFFPVNSLPAMRAASGLADKPDFVPFCDAMFKAVWAEGRNIGEASVRAEIGEKVGLSSESIEALANSTENKEALRASSDEAVARGAFGAPTFFVGEDMFFGQDRLDFVEEALTA
jgi:2-hydroxychromene-2-carboxylate isomerase